MGLENFDVLMAQLVNEISTLDSIAKVQGSVDTLLSSFADEDEHKTHVAIGANQTLDIPTSFYKRLSDAQKILLMSILQNSARLIAMRIEENKHELSLNTTLLEERAHYEALANEVAAQNHLKDQLFTILAHDLRGPIGTARNILALVCEDSKAMSPEDLKDTLPEILRSVESSYNLLENLLYWVRSQMQEISVLRERVSVQSIIRNLIGWLDKTILSKGLGIDVQCPAELSIETDSRMVETILRNFLSNAIKFSKKGGVIQLIASFDSESEELKLSVTDQGVGMTDEQMKSLFGNIIKGSSGTKGERGSGLGLLFSNDMAKRLQGRIEVSSVLGEGSTFSLVLPDKVEGYLTS